MVQFSGGTVFSRVPADSRESIIHRSKIRLRIHYSHLLAKEILISLLILNERILILEEYFINSLEVHKLKDYYELTSKESRIKYSQ